MDDTARERRSVDINEDSGIAGATDSDKDSDKDKDKDSNSGDDQSCAPQKGRHSDEANLGARGGRGRGVTLSNDAALQSFQNDGDGAFASHAEASGAVGDSEDKFQTISRGRLRGLLKEGFPDRRFADGALQLVSKLTVFFLKELAVGTLLEFAGETHHFADFADPTIVKKPALSLTRSLGIGFLERRAFEAPFGALWHMRQFYSLKLDLVANSDDERSGHRGRRPGAGADSDDSGEGGREGADSGRAAVGAARARRPRSLARRKRAADAAASCDTRKRLLQGRRSATSELKSGQKNITSYFSLIMPAAGEATQDCERGSGSILPARRLQEPAGSTALLGRVDEAPRGAEDEDDGTQAEEEMNGEGRGHVPFSLF